MKSLLRSVVLLFVLAASVSSVSFAQANPSVPNDVAAMENHGIDSISLQNLSVLVRFPIRSRKGFSYTLNGVSDCEPHYDVNLGSWFLVCGIGNQNKSYSYTDYLPVPSTDTILEATVGDSQTPNVDCTNVNNGISTSTEFTNLGVLDSMGGWHPVQPTTTAIYLANAGQADCKNNALTYQFQDNSGLTLSLYFDSSNILDWTIYSSGGITSTKTGPGSNSTKLTDTNGNTLYAHTSDNLTWTYYDALGTSYSPLSYTWAASGSPRTYQYLDVNGNTQQIKEVYTSKTVSTSFGCGSDAPSQARNVMTSLSYPDGSSVGISYETNGSAITGRLKTLTLRTGGQITYAYSGGNSGLNCTYSVPPTMTRTTPDGVWTYTWATVGSPVYGNQTTVLDPGKNKKVYTFTGLTATGLAPMPTAQVLTQVQTYQNTGTVSSPVYTLLSNDVICYNGASSGCATATVNFPITQKDVYHYAANLTSATLSETKYDSYGNVTFAGQSDFGSAAFVRATTITYGTYNGGNCSQIATYINNRPCKAITMDNVSGVYVAQKAFYYDGKGNLTQEQVWTGGGNWIAHAQPNTYNSNGTLATTFDPNGTKTTVTYGNCNGFFPTEVSVTSGGTTIETDATAYCSGMVPHTTTDANENITTYSYTNGSAGDPFWRLLSVTDPQSNVATYAPGITSTNVQAPFLNGTTSLDSQGRVTDTQLVDGSNYDTASNQYSFNGVNWTSSGSVPCSTSSLGSPCSYFTTKTVDPLGRSTNVTDAKGGYSTFSYAQTNSSALAFDSMLTVGPAPSGEHVKSVQTEVDGLGRVKSVCGILTGAGSCGQANAANGIVTANSYSDANGSTTVASTRGVQTRTRTFDAAGRLTYESHPESGAVTYVYDTDSACTLAGSQSSSTGDLISSTDANGYKTCRTYDNLHRLTDVVVIKNGACVPPTKRFRYDSMSNAILLEPSGYAGSNLIGAMLEAWTGDCTYPPASNGSTSTTDEWFSYDSLGQTTDIWESTWHIPGYFHSTATYAANGAITSIGGVPGYSAMTYGLDSNGRPNTATQGSTNIVTGVSYNAAGQPTSISIGAGDSDSYTYDPKTGSMTNYTFAVGATPKTQSGTLTWDTDGALGTLATTDTFNSGGAQTCNFSYDDLARLITDNCGSTIWNQAFSYDQYDNITKTGNPGTSWQPGYNSANNHYSLGGTTYDADGNLTDDSFHDYGWFADGKLQSVDSTDCTIFTSTTGTCVIYDAFGRLAEVGVSGSYTEVLYTPVGKTAIMNGMTTVQQAFFPLPGGATVNESGSSGAIQYFWHKDWLGSARLASSIPDRVYHFDRAFTPYGESYQNFGNTSGLNFTGDTQDTFAGLFDTPNRELNPVQSRWLTPDPARAGWNLYAYVTDPNTLIDPSGLGEGPPFNPYGTLDDLWGQGNSQAILDGTNQQILFTHVHQYFTVKFLNGTGNYTDLSTAPTITDLSTVVSDNSGAADDPITASMMSSDKDISLDIANNVAALAPAMQQGAAFANTATAVIGGAYATAGGIVASPAVASAGLNLGARAFGWGYAIRGFLTGATGYVIGRWPGYVQAAEDMGAGKLNAASGIFKFFSNAGVWDTLNRAYINAQVFANQELYLSDAPIGQEGSGFAMELEHLRNIGVGPDQWQFVPDWWLYNIPQ